MPTVQPSLVLEKESESENAKEEKGIQDIIPAYLPACQVHLFSGASGAGKTALTFSLLQALATQTTFLGMKARTPAFVGYVAADRTWNDHRIWLQTVGLSDLPYYSIVDDRHVTGEALRSRKFGNRFQLLKRCIAGMLVKQCLASPFDSVDVALRKLPKDAFIVVDPISVFLGGDLLKYDLVFTHMLDLSQFCIEYQCTIFGIAHAGKQKNDPSQRYTRPQDRIVGTTAQTGCAGTTMHLAPESETGKPWYEFAIVPHHAEAKGLKLRRKSNGLFEHISDEEVPLVAPPIETKFLNKLAKDGTDILPYLDFDQERHVRDLYSVIRQPKPIGLGIGQTQFYSRLGKLEMFGLAVRGISPGTWKALRKS